MLGAFSGFADIIIIHASCNSVIKFLSFETRNKRNVIIEKQCSPVVVFYSLQVLYVFADVSNSLYTM
jgi:hypothetical protein